MIKKGAILIILILCTLSVQAENLNRYATLESTLVEVNGTTNISRFRLTYNNELDKVEKNIITLYKKGNCTSLVSPKLTLEIKRFKSHNPIAEKGFFKLVKANKYPLMYIETDEIQLINIDDSRCNQEKVRVKVTITGVSKEYEIPYQQKLTNNLLTIAGNVKISIKDFGLTPPDDLLGLVKTSEWVTIYLKMDFMIQ